MKQSVRDLKGDRILAADGVIGFIDDAYFDDDRWAVRYVVVDTGEWLPGRRVLISPAAMEAQSMNDPNGTAVRVKLTREQVRSAPDIDSALPVSRQQEEAYAAHLGFPRYWGGAFPLDATGHPAPPTANEQVIPEGDAHLRSAREVIGYRIEALDGRLGEVQDLVIEDGSWAISELVVDTRAWWPGGHVRVAPEKVEHIDWSERTVRLSITRDELKHGAQSGTDPL